MAEAEVGDEQRGEGPTVNALNERVAMDILATSAPLTSKHSQPERLVEPIWTVVRGRDQEEARRRAAELDAMVLASG